MPTLFRITRIRRTAYFDVWAGELPSAAELRARREHLREMGWAAREISRELASMRALHRKNDTKTNSLALSLDYVFTYLEPGDVLWVGDWLTVCSVQGAA